MKNDFKWILVYILTIELTVFFIGICLELYYVKEEVKIMRQHNELALEIRVERLEDIFQ